VEGESIHFASAVREVGVGFNHLLPPPSRESVQWEKKGGAGMRKEGL